MGSLISDHGGPMKRFAWLALAILALALSAPTEADATLVPGKEVVVALAAVGLPSELAPPTIEVPFVLSSAFDVESPFNVEAPLTSRLYGPSSPTTIAKSVQRAYWDAMCGNCGEGPEGFQILLEFRVVLDGS